MPASAMDPRTRRSRSALETALRELITERDLSQISVSDITKRAGVNRSTFYEHYTDVHDLAAAACTSVFDELVATSPVPLAPLDAEGVPVADPLPDLFAHVAENAPLYRALLGDDGSARVINHLLHRMAVAALVRRIPADAEAPLATIPSAGPVGPVGPVEPVEPLTPFGAEDSVDVPHDPAAVFVAGAVLNTVIDWLRRDCPGTPEAMAAALWPLLIGTAKAAGWAPGAQRPQGLQGLQRTAGTADPG
ncbi:TetR/AcrR family transcriptional regulator [Streptomyces sp. NPDC001815]|uniref:TetR/AcrR family transcriptional regulator n=1 Tax=Streptomyces sp. NPDC001815 TaxID=3154526 RepID=UPI0033205DE8